MAVDYVRVYQPKDKRNVGCDPEDFPTADYINTWVIILIPTVPSFFDKFDYEHTTDYAVFRTFALRFIDAYTNPSKNLARLYFCASFYLQLANARVQINQILQPGSTIISKPGPRISWSTPASLRISQRAAFCFFFIIFVLPRSAYFLTGWDKTVQQSQDFAKEM